MRKTMIAGIVVGALGLGALGWWAWQEQLQPLPLAAEAELWEKPNPEGEQDMAQLELLLAAGPGAQVEQEAVSLCTGFPGFRIGSYVKE